MHLIDQASFAVRSRVLYSAISVAKHRCHTVDRQQVEGNRLLKVRHTVDSSVLR